MPKSMVTAIGTTAVALALVVTGCSGGGAEGELRTLYLEAATDPTSFDPATARGSDDYEAAALLYDTLLNRNDDGALLPGLARDWTQKSAMEYEFTIASGATCADGTPITAEVVASSLTYLAGDRGGVHVFAPLVFGAGSPTITVGDGGSTVAIKTAQPYANLLQGLTIPQSGVVCPAGLTDLDGLKNGALEGAFSGPYVLAEAARGVSYTYDLREGYDQWPELSTPLEGKPAPRLVFSIATDEATTANKLLSGDLSVGSLGSEGLDRIQEDEYNRLSTVSANVFVMFNERPDHYFADQAARQAVARAIDRELFNQVFSNGANPLFDSIVPDSYECALHDPSLIEQHDHRAAATVLAGAKIKMVTSTALGDDGKGAEYIQQALSDAGASVDLVKTDNATWASVVASPTGDWDITVMADSNYSKIVGASLERVMGPALEDGGRNIPGSDNAEGAAAVRQAIQTTSKAEQCELYQSAQRSMLQRDDIVPLTGVMATAVSASDVVVRAPGGTLDYSTTRIVSP